MSLDTALNVPGGTLAFTTGGNYSWFEVGPPDTHDGVAAAQACLAEANPGEEIVAIFDDEACYVETTVTGPKTVKFWWKVESEEGYDFIKFEVDDGGGFVLQDEISGDVDWEEKTYDLALAVVYTLRWTYYKDMSYSDWRDTAWLDEIEEIPFVPPPLPGKATDPDPEDLETGVLVSKFLSWVAGADATSHDVYFGTSYPPSPIGNQDGTTYNPPGNMNYGDTYYWRIDEVNITGTTTGDDWSFETEALPLPNPAYSPDPTNGETLVSDSKILNWSAGTYAASHDVYFGTTSPLGPGDFQGNQSGTSYNPGGMLYNQTYYWRIDEVNVTGTTSGTEWTFETEASGGADFSGDPTSGDVPLLVNFTDLTAPVPTAWLWNFGVGTGEGTSPLQNPSHTYNTPGNFNVRLRAYSAAAGFHADRSGAYKSGEIYMGTEYSGPGDPYLEKVIWQTSQTLIWDADPTKVHVGDMVADPRPGYDWIYFICTDFGHTDEVYRVHTDGTGLEMLWDLSAWSASGSRIGWNYSGSSRLMVWPGGVYGELVWFMSCGDGEGLPPHSWQPFIELLGGWRKAPCTACCTFSDGRFAAVSMAGGFGWRKLREWNIPEGFIVKEKDPGYYSEEYGYGAEDNSQNAFYWTDYGGINKLGRWNLGPDTVEQTSLPFSVTKPVIDSAASGNLVYFPPSDGLMRRYNHTTHTWATWDGSIYDDETKWAYIYAGTTPLPGKATDPDPYDTETGVLISKVLNWTAGADATSHDVYFGTSYPPSPIGNQLGTSYDPGALNYGDTYYWRIDEVNDTGTTTGDDWTFDTESAPPAPDKATDPDPPDDATGVVITQILSWTAGSEATSHNVYFGTSPSPSEVSHEQVGITYDPGTLNYNDTYYWRIDEVNIYGTTTGDDWSFETETTPSVLEDLLVEVTNEITIEGFYFKNEIIFSFDDTQIAVDTYVNLAIRGKQLSGTPDTFPLIVLIKLGSTWYPLDPYPYTITFGSTWTTHYWEHILNTRLTRPQINYAKIAIIPRDDLDINGVAISEVKLFSIEPTYELFDVSLTVSNEDQIDTELKENYIKVYKSSHGGFYGGGLYGSGLYGS